MKPQHCLDIEGGDAIVIVTRAATLRVDCHKMDGDWSLLLRHRADKQPSGGRKDGGQKRPLEDQAEQTGAISVAGGPGHAGQPPVGPNPTSGQPAKHDEIKKADKPPLVPAKAATENAPANADAKEQTDVTPLLLDAKAVATMLSVSGRTIFRLSSSGQLGPMPVAVGGRSLWRRDEVAAWVQAGCPRREAWLKMAQEKGFGRPGGRRF